MKEEKPKEIEVGSKDPVIINKMFGPTIFANLRVTADPETCEWVIERSSMIKKGKHQGYDSFEHQWIEWVRIPGQMDQDFSEHGYYVAAPPHSEGE